MSMEDMLDVISRAETSVFIRLRKDGHPVGAVVASRVIDREIYTVSNLYRAAYWNIRRDDRCCAVFNHPDASVTVIGRAEIVYDNDMVRKFFLVADPAKNPLIQQGRVTEEQFLEWAASPNRVLFHIKPEKFFSSDMRTLGRPDEIEFWLQEGHSWGGFQQWKHMAADD
jgi:hypothetical protein